MGLESSRYQPSQKGPETLGSKLRKGLRIGMAAGALFASGCERGPETCQDRLEDRAWIKAAIRQCDVRCVGETESEEEKARKLCRQSVQDVMSALLSWCETEQSRKPTECTYTYQGLENESPEIKCGEPKTQ